MNVKIEDSWKQILSNEWNKDYFIKLTEFVRNEYATGQVFPPGKEIFAAFDATPFEISGFSTIDFITLATSALLVYVSAFTLGKMRVVRTEGLIFLTIYIAYTIYLLIF